MEGRVLYFDKFRLDLRTGELFKEGRTVRLPPQPTKLLLLLVRSPGALVTHDEIHKELWGEDTFVDFEQAVKKCVKQVRAALGDEAEEPVYVETVPRRGYRFIGPLRVEGGEVSPYPGLSAFSEKDARFFFGREGEAEALWNKIERRKLLALIGPSGAGKSSFLRAGLLPSRREGWQVAIVTPGNSAMSASPSPDTEGPLLLVVDAFEELFTRNPPEVQSAFSERLGVLSREKEVHVLLSMRDDFLFRCHEQESLQEVFFDLTPLGPLSGPALRQALEKPASACGYRFEEGLVELMLREVQTLPLLAFAAAQLWEKRDRERKVLTQAAYEEIGRAGGALAQHAERTLQSLGSERQSTVREIFRNLTTSHGTRVSMGKEELLSIFPDRETAASVLSRLIGARLVTSSEIGIEIVHESLLTAWPRLTRWQAQDAEGAVLRDQLRQAARLWEQRGRTDDLLWTGTAFRDLAIWRERHSSGLTGTEEEFAERASRRATRNRRVRRVATAVVLAAAVAVSSITTALWRRSEKETLRAEASKLLALGQMELESNATAALAYTVKSLELSDTSEARLFALRVLQREPLATKTPPGASGAYWRPAFSPDGEWLAFGGWNDVEVFNRDGQRRIRLGAEIAVREAPFAVGFGPGGDVVAGDRGGEIRVWSLPDGRELRRESFELGLSWLFGADDGFVTATIVGSEEVYRHWRFDSGEPLRIGSMAEAGPGDVSSGLLVYAARGPETEFTFASRNRPAQNERARIYRRSLDDWSARPELLAEHSAGVNEVALSPDGRRFAASDDSGEIRIWSTASPAGRPLRVLRGRKADHLRFDATGTRLAGIVREEARTNLVLWSLTAPPAAEPLVFGGSNANGLEFEPSGRWLATTQASTEGDAALWLLEGPFPQVLLGHERNVVKLVFTPDGKQLLSASNDGTVRSWQLSADGAEESRILLRTEMFFPSIAVEPSSQNVFVSTGRGRLLVVPLNGGPPREVSHVEGSMGLAPIALGDGGRLAVMASSPVAHDPGVVRVWDVETGKERLLPSPHGVDGDDKWFYTVHVRDAHHLVSCGGAGLLVHGLDDASVEVLAAQPRGGCAIAGDGRTGVGVTEIEREGRVELIRFTLDDGSRPVILPSHGRRVEVAALDPSDTLVATGSADGTVRIGHVSGEEPHVFLGHEGAVLTVAFSPDSRWVASAGADRSIRIWPVPDVTRTPLHLRSHEELLATLRSRTNLRVVPDPESSTGWKLDVGPFPGWGKSPGW